MILVHHLENSRSHRVLWALEELGLPYELVRYARDPHTMRAPAALKKIHPLGKSPVLVDDCDVMVESGAILEYLVERYGHGDLKPLANPDLGRYRQWMHYAEGSAMPLMLLKLVFDRLEAADLPFFAKPIARKLAGSVRDAFIRPQIQLHLDYLEAALRGRPWFTGETLTAADIQMSFPLEAAFARAELTARHPRLMDFLRRIHERPAYVRATLRGGELRLR